MVYFIVIVSGSLVQRLQKLLSSLSPLGGLVTLSPEMFAPQIIIEALYVGAFGN